MKKYIFQLTEDIREARHSFSETIDLDNDDSFEDFFSNIHKLPGTEIENGNQFSDLIDLDATKFPPIEKLDAIHLQILITSLESLLESWKIIPILPQSLPNKNKYLLYLQLFDIRVNGKDFVKYEFCNNDTENCVFTTEHCLCLQRQKAIELKSREMEKYMPVIFSYIENIHTILSHTGKFELKIGYPKNESPFKPLREWFQMPPEIYAFSQDYEKSQYMKVINKTLSLWNLDKNFRKWFRSHELLDRYIMLSELLNLYVFYSDGSFYIGDILPEAYSTYNSMGSIYIFALEELVESEL